MMQDQQELRRELHTMLQPGPTPPDGSARVRLALTRRHRRTRIAAAVGACGAAGATVAIALAVGGNTVDEERPRQTPASAKGETQAVDYVTWSFANGDYDIYFVDPGSGGERRVLARTEHDEYDPGLSRATDQVVFVRLVDERDSEIYIVEQDGTGARQLTDGPRTAGGPSISPDGTQLAYWRQNENGLLDIFLVDLGSDKETQVTPSGTTSANPWWSQAGDALFFTRLVEGTAKLIELDIETGTERVVTDQGVRATPGDTSEDGSRLAVLAGTKDSTSSQIRVVDRATGSELWRSDESFTDVQDIHWDGEEIFIVYGPPVSEARTASISVAGLPPVETPRLP